MVLKHLSDKIYQHEFNLDGETADKRAKLKATDIADNHLSGCGLAVFRGNNWSVRDRGWARSSDFGVYTIRLFKYDVNGDLMCGDSWG